MTTEAQKAAMRRYYEKSKKNYKTYLLRFKKKEDADVIEAFDNASSNTELVRSLIRGKKHNG